MNAKLLVAATMLLGASAMAQVTFKGNMATSIQALSGEKADNDNATPDGKSVHHVDQNSGAFIFDQGRFGITGGTEKVAFAARLNYSPGSDGSDLNIDEANVTYKTEMFNFTFGRIASALGLESSTFGKNATYTRSITSKKLVVGANSDGIALSKDLGMATVGLSMTNRTISEDVSDENKRKDMELTATGKAMDSKLEWFAGYLMGEDGETTFTKHTNMNLWAMYSINDAINAGLEYTSYGKKIGEGDDMTATGTVIYATYGMDMHTFALRYEMVSDDDNLAATGAKKHTSITLADKMKLEDNLHLFAEYRMNGADEDIFADKDGEAKNSGTAMTLGLVATF